MFECKGCEAMNDEVRYLRDQLKDLTNKLTAIADVRAFEAVKFERPDVTQYYGSSPDDEYVGYNESGQKILLKKDVEIV